MGAPTGWQHHPYHPEHGTPPVPADHRKWVWSQTPDHCQLIMKQFSQGPGSYKPRSFVNANEPWTLVTSRIPSQKPLSPCIPAALLQSHLLSTSQPLAPEQRAAGRTAAAQQRLFTPRTTGEMGLTTSISSPVFPSIFREMPLARQSSRRGDHNPAPATTGMPSALWLHSNWFLVHLYAIIISAICVI